MRKGPRIAGRYEVHDAIASGGMATVHLGRLQGQAGFSRIVAIKQLRGDFAETPELVSTLLDEARLASRIRHPNVVATLDVVAEEHELLLVLEYVHGESLSRLLRTTQEAGEEPPLDVIAAIVVGTLDGLHAAHEASSPTGDPLGIVHRDVSPQNVIVGVDGHARVLDFGVAKARGRLQSTQEGQLKGKLAYMAPEQIAGHVSRRSDIFAAGIVLWEALTGKRLFSGNNEAHLLANVISARIPPPSEARPDLDRAFDDIVMRALDRDPDRRFPTADAFARAIETGVPIAPPSEVGKWVSRIADDTLAARSARVTALERGGDLPPAAPTASEDPTRTATVVAARPAPMARRSNLPWIFAAGITAFAIGALSLVLRGSPGSDAAVQGFAPGLAKEDDRAAPAVAVPPPEATSTPDPDPPAADSAVASSSASPPTGAKPLVVFTGKSVASPTPPPASASPTPEPSGKKSPFYRFE